MKGKLRKILAIFLTSAIMLTMLAFPASAATHQTYYKNIGEKIDYKFSLKEENNGIVIEIGNLKNLEDYVKYLLGINGHFMFYIFLDDDTYYFSEYWYSPSVAGYVMWSQYNDKK